MAHLCSRAKGREGNSGLILGMRAGEGIKLHGLIVRVYMFNLQFSAQKSKIKSTRKGYSVGKSMVLS